MPSSVSPRPAARVLIVITGDPRRSPRPAEAVRIAAGLGVWGSLDLSVVLCGAAVCTLTAGAGDLLEEDTLIQCLPLLAKHRCAIYAGPGRSQVPPAESLAVPVQKIDVARLARLAAQCQYLLRF